MDKEIRLSLWGDRNVAVTNQGGAARASPRWPGLSLGPSSCLLLTRLAPPPLWTAPSAPSSPCPRPPLQLCHPSICPAALLHGPTEPASHKGPVYLSSLLIFFDVRLPALWSPPVCPLSACYCPSVSAPSPTLTSHPPVSPSFSLPSIHAPTCPPCPLPSHLHHFCLHTTPLARSHSHLPSSLSLANLSTFWPVCLAICPSIVCLLLLALEDGGQGRLSHLTARPSWGDAC